MYIITLVVCSHHSSILCRRCSPVFVGLNRPAHTMVCTQAVLDPRSVCTRRPAVAGGVTTFFPSQLASKSQHFSKRYTGGTIISSSRAIVTKHPQHNFVHRTIIPIFHVTVVITSAHVGTAAYSYITRAVRAGMKLSISVEHPGDLLLTVTESFSEYYVSWLRKLEKCVVPCAFSGISLRCCLPLIPLGSLACR